MCLNFITNHQSYFSPFWKQHLFFTANINLTIVVYFTSPTSKLKNNKKHHFTSIYQHLGVQIQQKSTKNMWLPSMEPTYPAWGTGTSSTQKCWLVWEMLVPKRVILLPSSIRSFISGWIMIFQCHQPQPFSEVWLNIRQQFRFPRLIPPVIESILI